MFIEADADVRLDQFNNINDLQPPFPCVNELLYLDPGSVDLINSPLLLIQVTRLLCGGFILAVRLNHTISDAQGLKQFLMALGEIARGYESPSVLPVWQRELLSSHEPPATPNKECDLFHRTRLVSLPFSQNQEVQRTFFFGLQEMISLKKHLPLHLHTCSKFEILTACLWRCRTLAFNLDPKEDVLLFFSVNGRGKDRLNLPEGFYSNALGCGMAFSTAEKLCRNSFEYTLDLVVKSKNKLLNTDTKEDKDTTLKNKMLKSWTDFTTNNALVGNHYFWIMHGWGKAVYAGPMIVHHIPNPEDSSFYIPYDNSKGDYGVYVPIFLRQEFLKRFVVEVGRMISEPPIRSAL
ncbi:hypothetical protein MKW98_016451 [Papaver atlanticum]|uniref:Uncharacterized protein n=1 Tax=Papaver atlanticum TaxID=357466 RepID=A0AAD4T9C5_9MAGN|nr:hypothetical protein MKW98_016451 [Papaver atlanticum]